MSSILAIDQSTSATKALLYSAGGELIDQASVEHRQIYPKPGWVEHDAEEIYGNVLRAAREVIERNRNLGLACLSIANQRETFVVFDVSSGMPLCNAIVWQCRRGEAICNELVNAGHNDKVSRKTGLRVDTYFSGSKIAWLLQNNAAVAAKVRSGAAAVATIDAYLVHRLTRGEVFATDHTNASRTLLYDIHSLDWCNDLCGLFGVSRKALPEIRDSAASFGSTDLQGLLPHPIPIRGVMGDSQAALFAQGCTKPGMAKITFGTGSSVLLNVGSSAPESGGGAVTTLAWTLDGEPTYCAEGLINYSAATIAWLRDRLNALKNADEAESLATSIPDNGGVYLVPAFAGMGAPYWRADARGAIVGLSAHSGREHIVRAALESIAYQVRDVLEMLRNQSGVKLNSIYADGGPTANRFLMQFCADICGIEVKVAAISDCSALGAAMMGAIGSGFSLPAAPKGKTCKPSMPAECVHALYAGWKHAVECVVGQSLEHHLVEVQS